MREIRSLQDVLDWQLCMGCGACYAFCTQHGISLSYFDGAGIRPVIANRRCPDCNLCLEFCPGYTLKIQKAEQTPYDPLIGHYHAIYEGYARNANIRYKGSSGGTITALAAFCLEQLHMHSVLHTGMDKEKPWQNVPVESKNQAELLNHTGSRYSPSSPCAALSALNEQPGRQYVFIGKPCDAAALAQAKRLRPAWEEKIRLTISFFCAGTPSQTASLRLLEKLGIPASVVKKITYRGDGWPGGFQAFDEKEHCLKFLPYLEAWSFLTKYRPFRCHICPDGLGEFADITCGDAWHKYKRELEDPGRSIIIARTIKGKEVLAEAAHRGYLVLEPLAVEDVIKAQGLVKRREELYGRLFAMKLLLRPYPQFTGFSLKKSYQKIPFIRRVRIVCGTIKRLVVRGLWRRSGTGSRLQVCETHLGFKSKSG